MSDERTRLLVQDEEHLEQVTLITPSNTTITTNVPTPLPWRPLLVLLMLKATQALAFEVVFPFVNKMILEMGIAKDPESVGFYSGLIESIYYCTSLIAILPCSALADRIGRKPVILGGILGLALSIVCFGMSRSFLTMVVSRSLGFAVSCVEACMRIVIGEMTDKSNQGVAFAAIMIAYRIGQIIGLPLGGLLAHPERHFSSFRTPFWLAYPFALPCFVASALCVFTVIVGYFSLQETLRSKGEHITERTAEGSTTNVGSSPSTVQTSDDADPQSRAIEHRYKSIMTPSIVSLLFSNGAMCLVSETLFAVFPLFAFTPVSSGGLGLSEAAIGTQLGIRAALHLLTMGLLPTLQQRLGTVRTYQVSMWTLPVTAVSYPLLNVLARRSGTSSWTFMLGIFVFMFVWSIGGLAWTTIAIMVTDSTPSAEALATMNGVSQMARIISPAIAPVFGTSLFAASIKSGIAGGNMVWLVLFVMTAASAMHSMKLREPETDWRKG